jgi:hypothetical protein
MTDIREEKSRCQTCWLHLKYRGWISAKFHGGVLIMAITLSISAADLENDQLQELTRQLCRDLSNEDAITAELATQPTESDSKGDRSRSPELVILGKILVSVFGGGGFAVALANVLKSYSQRKASLQFELQKKNGEKMIFKADNLQSRDMTELVAAINRLVG